MYGRNGLLLDQRAAKEHQVYLHDDSLECQHPGFRMLNPS